MRPGRKKGDVLVNPINLDELKKLASLHCTDSEIAAWFDISVDTLDRYRRRFPEIAETIKNGREQGKISLRRNMWLMAQNHAGMCIFLAKNLLGMADDPNAPMVAEDAKFDLSVLSKEELESIVTVLKKARRAAEEKKERGGDTG